jgi:deoxyhypusine synthase
VAHSHYERVPHYRDLTPADEQALLDRHLNRVTDTCIPEEEAMRRIERIALEEWMAADQRGDRLFPHEFLYRILRAGTLKQYFEIDPKNSWLLAASDANLPIFVHGWEDSTLGNVFAAHCLSGRIKSPQTMRGGIEYMMELANWYRATSPASSIGFFQIGGGIAGDFPICVVPMLHQDLRLPDIPLGDTSARCPIRRRATGPIRGRCPTKRSRGANSARRRRSSSSSPTRRSSSRSCSPAS